VIYLDTSVLLAQLLAEDRRPPASLWAEPLIASRLLEYETWVRLNAVGCAASHGDAARELLARTSLIELSPLVLQRALEPFPRPVRTLDALHLASMHFLAEQRLHPRLASYDQRLVEAAQAMGIELFDLDRPRRRR
jgi:predicted nucleic acid-binding protein